MQELEIKVTHEVSPDTNNCTYGGDYWEKMYAVIMYIETERMEEKRRLNGAFPSVRCLINGWISLIKNARSANGLVRRRKDAGIREDSGRDERN